MLDHQSYQEVERGWLLPTTALRKDSLSRHIGNGSAWLIVAWQLLNYIGKHGRCQPHPFTTSG